MTQQLTALSPTAAPRTGYGGCADAPAPALPPRPPGLIIFAPAGEGSGSAEPEVGRGTGLARRLSILVVDDDDSFRDAFVRRLFDLGNAELSVDDADSGEVALARVADPAHSYDVAFIDLNLPKMSGLDTRAEIEGRTLGVRLYLMTSDVGCEEALTAQRRGFKVYNKWSLGDDLISILFGGPDDEED